MELYTVHNKILEPFTIETVKSLSTMANLTANTEPGFQESLNEFKFRGFAVLIITKAAGNIVGKVLMNFDTNIAIAVGNRISRKLIGEDSTVNKLNEDVREAVTEFTNTVIGLTTDDLSKTKIKIKFDPPLYITDDNDVDIILGGVKEILTIPINIDHIGKFYFSYLLHNNSD